MPDEPRAFTKEEGCQMFLASLRSMVNYWANDVDNQTCTERMEGLVHSILCIIDGVGNSELPALTLTTDPNPEDKEFLIDEGENYWEPTALNESVYLHEMWK